MPIMLMAALQGIGLVSQNSAFTIGSRSRCIWDASAQLPESARDVILLVSAGMTLLSTEMTPWKPSTISGIVRSSLPQ